MKHGESTGGSRSTEYGIWQGMRQRCGNPNNPNYARYGGRGIRVCKEWQDSFANFLAHMGRRPSRDHSIDRIDNSKGYEPGNVRWATAAEQNRNCSRNIVIEHDGRAACLEDWAAELGVSPMTLKWRLRHHPVAVALTPGRNLAGALDPTRVRGQLFVGFRVGRLVLVERLGATADEKSRWWKCQCDCGNTKELRSGCLRRAHTRSCGCLQREMSKNRLREGLTGKFTEMVEVAK